MEIVNFRQLNSTYSKLRFPSKIFEISWEANRANNTSPPRVIIPSVLAFSLILAYFHRSRGNFDLVVGGPFDQGPQARKPYEIE